MEQSSNDNLFQIAKNEMRELFIHTLTSLIGKKCVVRTRNIPIVEGIFRGYYGPGDVIVVSNLKPPFHILPEMIIRMCDVVHLTLGNVIVQIKDDDN